MRFLFFQFLLLLNITVAHPPVDVPVNSLDYNSLILPAVTTFKNISHSLLQPYQDVKLNCILTHKKQLVNGYNVFATVVMEEDMTFMGKNRGWPSYQLHNLRMFRMIGATDWTVMSNEVPPKIQVIDETDHQANKVDVIKVSERRSEPRDKRVRRD